MKTTAASLRACRIMVVDDNVDAAESLAMMLEGSTAIRSSARTTRAPRLHWPRNELSERDAARYRVAGDRRI